ncbi:hypothetical protein MARPU_14430 [Marichromatium purpuratum 984]|uniref:Glycosyl transferase n=1 Tax=Marichromatium purpuratum 984 TaxID=765910 RepID=W0E4F1_MARPU|nr:glycosyltransferase family 9 protein [Marichromatium purpuratum]AHF05627.1 hypothetical protein MARPU_14430 [Marichromatium purpuratum 984]
MSRTHYKIVNARKRWLTRLADLIGAPLSLPWRWRRQPRPIDPAEVREILLIRTLYLGDVIMTMPMLRPLRERFPDARITLLTAAGAAPLLEGNPDLDALITYDPFWFSDHSGPLDYLRWRWRMRHRRFDLVIEARADIREILMLVRPLQATHKVSYGVGGGAWMLTRVVPYPGLKHKVEYHLDLCRALGCRVEGVHWGVHHSSAERAAARQLLAERGITRPFVAVHPGSRLVLKCWPAARYGALVEQIGRRLGLAVVLFGGPDERALAAEVAGAGGPRVHDLSGQLGLRAMAALLREARVLVCNDSAPLHLAAALGTPALALFGPSSSRETRPYGNGHRVVEVADLWCRAGCDEHVCRHPERQWCMRQLGVDQVFTVLCEMLAAEVSSAANWSQNCHSPGSLSIQ